METVLPSESPPSSEFYKNPNPQRLKLILSETVLQNPWVVKKPWMPGKKPNRKQEAFLSNFKREVLYGGAAGGGKSIAILAAAAQFVEESDYACLILRRSYADLALPGALMDEAQQWWAALTVNGQRAKWNSQDHTWTFPSGATITFGYLERENDKYRYASAEFQFIAFDELTTFTEAQYRFLFSRLRRKTGSTIPLRMRSASNPGGIGHGWVKRRFIKDNTSPNREFIPAKLKDNPHADEATYRESLSELPPEIRKQLEEGSWDEFQGGRFQSEWFRYYSKDEQYWMVFSDELRYHEETLKDRFMTVDPASTVKEVTKPDPDYTVISSWLVTPCGLLVATGCWRGRIEAPDIPPRMAEQYRLHKCGRAHVEGGGTQKGTAQHARRYKLSNKPGDFMNIVEYVPIKDKLEYSMAARNLMKAGRVWFPLDDPMFPLEDVQEEIVRFTGDEKQDPHDDIVSALSIAAHNMMMRDDQKPATSGFRFQAVGGGTRRIIR